MKFLNKLLVIGALSACAAQAGNIVFVCAPRAEFIAGSCKTAYMTVVPDNAGGGTGVMKVLENGSVQKIYQQGPIKVSKDENGWLRFQAGNDSVLEIASYSQSLDAYLGIFASVSRPELNSAYLMCDYFEDFNPDGSFGRCFKKTAQF